RGEAAPGGAGREGLARRRIERGERARDGERLPEDARQDIVHPQGAHQGRVVQHDGTMERPWGEKIEIRHPATQLQPRSLRLRIMGHGYGWGRYVVCAASVLMAACGGSPPEASPGSAGAAGSGTTSGDGEGGGATAATISTGGTGAVRFHWTFASG